MPEGWQVGHGAAALEVPAGAEMAGYAAREGVARGVLDPLEVHAVAFRDTGGALAVLCVADLLQVDDDLALACRQAVAAAVDTEPALVWLTATHTHAGPAPVADRVVPAAVGAARDATRAAVPARVALHRAELDGVGGQRTGADRRTTVPVDVLRVADLDGRLLGLVGVVPVHPTVLPATNLELSADLVGGVRRGVTALTGAWCAVLTGAAGDVSTRPHRREQTSVEVARLGDLTASALLEAAGAPALAEAAGPLAGRVDAVPMEAADLGAPFRRNVVAEARRSLATAEASADQGLIRDAQVTLQGAELAPEAGSGPASCAVAALDLGGIRLLGLGGEPFLALADAASAVEPSAVLVGYANGYCGYLPTRDAFARVEEKPEYEVLIARVGPGEPERALGAASALLDPVG